MQLKQNRELVVLDRLSCRRANLGSVRDGAASPILQSAADTLGKMNRARLITHLTPDKAVRRESCNGCTMRCRRRSDE
jgi:hypothetical protein